MERSGGLLWVDLLHASVGQSQGPGRAALPAISCTGADRACCLQVPQLLQFLKRYAPKAKTVIVCGGATWDLDKLHGLLRLANAANSYVLYSMCSRDLGMTLSNALAVSGTPSSGAQRVCACQPSMLHVLW